MSKKRNYYRPSQIERLYRWEERHDTRSASSHEDYDMPSFKAIIYQSELDYISRFMLDFPNIETGGQLFGYWTSTGTPVVMYAIGPGPNAMHHVTSFVQDQDYLQTVGRALHKRYRLQHIGEWHSHHRLGLTCPSGGDVNTMQYGVGKPGFPRLLLCIGTIDGYRTTVNPYNFHQNVPGEYEAATWDVIAMESPYRQLVDRELRQILIHPATRQASHGMVRTGRPRPANSSYTEHWLTENVKNVETMKEFVAIVKDYYNGYDVKVEMLPSGEPTIVVKDRNVSVKLPHGFPTKAPQLVLPDGDYHSTNINALNWTLGEEPLIDTFRRWFLAAQVFMPTKTRTTPPPFRVATVPPPLPEANKPPAYQTNDNPPSVPPATDEPQDEAPIEDDQIY